MAWQRQVEHSSIEGRHLWTAPPICSCGVLPIYETLIKRGVPASAAIGFLVATPELGLDAILISIPLLGPELTGVRLIAAFVVAYAVAVFVGRGLRSIAPMEQHSDSTPPLPSKPDSRTVFISV